MALEGSAPGLRRHRISVRFLTTLAVNALRMGLSFASGLLIAKGLGPARLGDYSFLSAGFLSFLTLIDLGSSSAFFTFISQSKKDRRFYAYYSGWMAIQAAAVISAVAFALPDSWVHWFWLGQSRSWITLAFISSFLSVAVWRIVGYIGESQRETVLVQKIRLVQGGAHLLLIGIAFWSKRLSVPLVFALIAAEYVLAAAGFAWRFDWKQALSEQEGASTLADTFRQYARYCRPLVLDTMVGGVAGYFGPWLLQFYAGSVQQGFFSIGKQFSIVSLLAVMSFINIFWKEIADAHARGDKEALRTLYLRATKALFFVAAAICCFLIPFSREILLILGPSYRDAHWSLAILLLYPIHQTLGQLNGSYLLASHQTRIIFLIGLLGTALGLPVCYFLLASPSARVPGLGLGAVGLALNQVIVQFILVNVQGSVICRPNGWRWPLAEQLGALTLLLSLGFACRGLVFNVLGAPASNLWLAPYVAASAALYALGVAAILYALPAFAGLEPAWARRLWVKYRHAA